MKKFKELAGAIVIGIISNAIYAKLTLMWNNISLKEVPSFLTLHPKQAIQFTVGLALIQFIAVIISYLIFVKSDDKYVAAVQLKSKMRKRPIDNDWIKKMRELQTDTLHYAKQLRTRFNYVKTTKGEKQVETYNEINELSDKIGKCGAAFQSYLNDDNELEKEYFNHVDLFIRRSVNDNFASLAEYNEMYKSVVIRFKNMIKEKI